MLLETQGHIVETAYSGTDAIEVARGFQPDLLLLDLSMPGMTGYEALTHIQQAAKNPKLVAAAMSGLGQEEDKQRTKAAGFNTHLVKPVDIPAFQSTISTVVKRLAE